MCSALVARDEPLTGSDVKFVLFVLFNNDVCVYYLMTVFKWELGRHSELCALCATTEEDNCTAVGAFAAVGVFANAGQQNLIEWLKGVRRYELSGCLRQAVVRSNEPGGAMQ